ncbi:hypothetical protein D0Y50_01175 [Salinimonas sediminis]|uniref:Uncharacterized protein n=1 Tax=Salinimonas sediminis TaxID=2303538 RepID=A0A346NHU3_9ALTE|nr:hypothetical protein D0Y50_01175 [Salinimonas sediminis]
MQVASAALLSNGTLLSMLSLTAISHTGWRRLYPTANRQPVLRLAARPYPNDLKARIKKLIL